MLQQYSALFPTGNLLDQKPNANSFTKKEIYILHDIKITRK